MLSQKCSEVTLYTKTPVTMASASTRKLRIWGAPLLHYREDCLCTSRVVPIFSILKGCTGLILHVMKLWQTPKLSRLNLTNFDYQYSNSILIHSMKPSINNQHTGIQRTLKQHRFNNLNRSANARQQFTTPHSPATERHPAQTEDLTTIQPNTQTLSRL